MIMTNRGMHFFAYMSLMAMMEAMMNKKELELKAKEVEMKEMEIQLHQQILELERLEVAAKISKLSSKNFKVEPTENKNGMVNLEMLETPAKKIGPQLRAAILGAKFFYLNQSLIRFAGIGGDTIASRQIGRKKKTGQYYYVQNVL